jgi:hypothetical protein
MPIECKAICANQQNARQYMPLQRKKIHCRTPPPPEGETGGALALVLSNLALPCLVLSGLVLSCCVDDLCAVLSCDVLSFRQVLVLVIPGILG